MQFVNVSQRTVYTSYSGSLAPGQVSADGGKKRRQLEEVLSDIVHVCGDRLGVRLNDKEVRLINKLMTLDEKGGGFKPDRLPQEIRDDPVGEKANEEAIRKSQQDEMDARSDANMESLRREAEINGETFAGFPGRKPSGPATLGEEGVKVDGSMLKSGFEKIMEENSRIAAGENMEDKEANGIGEALDPVGAHLSKATRSEEVRDDAAVHGGDPAEISLARNLEGDATRSADAQEPVPQAPEKGSAMDRKAAEVAKDLAHIGPKKKTAAKGKKK